MLALQWHCHRQEDWVGHGGSLTAAARHQRRQPLRLLLPWWSSGALWSDTHGFARHVKWRKLVVWVWRWHFKRALFSDLAKIKATTTSVDSEDDDNDAGEAVEASDGGPHMYLRTYTYGTYVHACSYVNRPHGVGGRWRQRPPAVTRSQKWFYAMEAGEAGGFLLQHHVVLVVQTTYKQDRVAAAVQ